MFFLQNAVILVAFVVFGLVGQVVVIASMGDNTLNKSVAGYFGFAIGFMIFGFIYFNNVIDQLKKELEQTENRLKTKNYIVTELREKLEEHEERREKMRIYKSEEDGAEEHA